MQCSANDFLTSSKWLLLKDQRWKTWNNLKCHGKVLSIWPLWSAADYTYTPHLLYLLQRLFLNQARHFSNSNMCVDTRDVQSPPLGPVMVSQQASCCSNKCSNKFIKCSFQPDTLSDFQQPDSSSAPGKYWSLWWKLMHFLIFATN